MNSKFKLINFQRILKKIIFLFPNFLGIILSPLIVLFIRVIRPIVLIRYALILSTRIGHFTENMDLYLCYKKKIYIIQTLKIIIKKLLIFFIAKMIFVISFF